MKKLIALSLALSACSAVSPQRTPSSAEGRALVAIDILCGSNGSNVQHAAIDLPQISDCQATAATPGYYRLDCSGHPIKLTVENETYLSQNPGHDLVFQGACGPAKAVKDCADLSGVTFNSLDQANPGARAIPELQLLKDNNGGSVELIVGKSADGAELEAKGLFRGCAVKYQ